MTQSDRDILALEAAFQEAAKGPDVPSALMARVLADGLAAQPVPVARARKVSFWAQTAALLGGWQGVGGMVAASCVGFWFGFSPPQNLQDTFDAAAYFQTQDADTQDVTLLGVGWDLEEG